MPKFTSSLLQKKALDALLDSMADGLDGHDNYDELGAHRRGEPWLPEGKGTELNSTQDSGEPVIIPSADLAQAPDPASAEFFKEGEPLKEAHDFEQQTEGTVVPVEHEENEHEFFKEAPEFEMNASGMRRVAKNGHSPEWQKIQSILQKFDYSWLGNVSDGTEMWGQKNKQLVYDPATRMWQHKVGGVVDLEGSVQELEQKIKAYLADQATPKSSALKSCVACECGDCIEHDKFAAITEFVEFRNKEAAEKLQAGGKGEDRNGEYDVVAINGNKITYRYSDGTTQEGDLAIKQRINDGIQAEKVRANEPKKIPGYLREDEIEWTPEMSWFLGYLAGPGKARIFAEAPPKYEEAVVNKYHDLTGIILEEKPGVFNIAPETKWSPELAVMFRPTEEIPDDIARQQQKPGLVNRNQFVWSLVRNGFRFGEKPNVELIRSKVPQSMQDYFDIGADVPQQHQAGLGTNRDYKTMDRKVRNALAYHKQLMDKYIAEGMTPGDASHKAYEEVKALGNKGVAKEFEKEAVTIMTYGMGQPIGGTESGNPDPDDEEDAENATMDMTGSLNDYDPDVEDQAFFAALDAEEDEADSRARSFAAVIDNTDLETIGTKLASSEEISWFAKSARPSPQKIELLQKQFKLTPEQIELCIATDPSPNQSDYVAWVAKFLSKGAFTLPEDQERIKGQLESFQKFKKSPQFLFSKDLQQYDPAKLFETLQKAEEGGMSSKKEEKRETVRKGAQIVVQEGNVTVYKVTEVKAANELGGGTNWCTADPKASHAQNYLSKGPLYIFFESGSAVAQLHCEDNLFMNRSDVCILESVTGENYRQNRNVKKFLADPELAKGLKLLAAKDPRVAEWAKENVADQEDVAKILGEEAQAEVEENVKYEKELEEYNKNFAVYQEQLEKYRPKQEKWNKQYEVYQQKMNEYHKKQEEWQAQDPSHGTSANPVPYWLERDRPKAPKRPDEPRAPYRPGQSYGYRNEPSGKKFVMQVKHALAVGQPLPPETEAQLVDSGVSTDLLLKYGSQFHPGQPWEPLAQSILREAQGDRGNKKQLIDYAVKFLKGRWDKAEPIFLNKMFLLQNNMQNMQMALEYAARVVKARWPEFEVQIQKAKPGLAAGYGAAEYAINVLKQPWHQLSGIKKKKNGRINAEECMIKGNPGEARKYAEAFFQGKRWEEFETSALEADNLNALINYAEGTLHARMPALEEKILSGTHDAQESKGRKRYRKFTNLPLEYSKKVIKGRWPEYEAKILEHVKADTPNPKAYNRDKYEPEVGNRQHYWHREQKISKKVSDYIEQVVQGRWPELEQILLNRYQEHPQSWVRNQNLIDGYLSTLASACETKNKDNRPPAPADDDDLTNQPMGTRPEKNDWKQQPFTRFTQDPQCYWAEGEKRLVTRDPGYEKVITDELRARVAADDINWTKDKEALYVSPEDLAKLEKAPEDISYEDQKKRPSWTVFNGMWIGWWGMDTIENYTRYMLANGAEWTEGVDIMEIEEDLEDVHRGRGDWNPRTNWKKLRQPQQQPEQPKAEGATASMKKKFQSGLLNKKALVNMHETPTMLPPRDDMRRHIDPAEQQAITDDVMMGVNPNDPTQLQHKPGMIDPRINPDGVVASQKKVARVSPQQLKNWLQTVPDFVHNLHITPVEGALQLEYKGKPIGWMGLPLEQVMQVVESVIGTKGLDANDEKIWDHILAPYGGQEMAFAASKQADYTDADAMDDEQTEYFLDQVRDAENEAKRAFMQDDYMQQLCDDYIPPKTMDQLWQVMKDEYTAEYFGTPYKRVPDFTDQESDGGWEGHKVLNDSTGNAGRFASCPLCKSANVKTIEDKDLGSNVILAECQDCAGFYSISER